MMCPSNKEANVYMADKCVRCGAKLSPPLNWAKTDNCPLKRSRKVSKKTKKELVEELKELGVYDTGEKIKEVRVSYAPSLGKMLNLLDREGTLSLYFETVHPVVEETKDGEWHLIERGGHQTSCTPN